MSSPRIYLHYLQDIIDNADKALEFVQGMKEEDFLHDDKTIFAVIRALEVMGRQRRMYLMTFETNILKFHGEILQVCGTS